jgi:predicted enzyme related to lactoylglutathione lyase
MIQQNDMQAGRFCWIDLATIDAPGAAAFYRDVFGWTAREQPANGGSFTRLQRADRDVGSLYQLSCAQVAQSVPSHWTPYVGVRDIDDAARRAVAAGGKLMVRPFLVSGVARIALIADVTGAHLGLWELSAAGAEKHDG